MGNHWGWGFHFVFVTIVLVATTSTCLGARNTTVTCFEHERLALFKLKHSVKDASHMLSSWVGNHCCQWERVTCDGVTGHVESLHLGGDCDGDGDGDGCLVSKKLSTSLGELRHLKYLDLSWNYFQGCAIPEFIGSLKQLTYLNLSGALFTGSIPYHMGNLSDLKILDLSSNQELIAHDMTWISGLSSLEHLDLTYANLSGTKNLEMVFYMIPWLKELSLSNCGLSNVDLGPLRNLSTSLSNIKHLDLSYNYFEGHLPPFFQNMTSLQFLDLSSFDFNSTWNFANFLSMIPSILELRLVYCHIKETYLSHTLHNLTTLSNIQHLDLYGNELTCPIPTFPGKLTELYLSFNNLNCSIPESLGNLRLLQTLDLSDNKLTGSIPESFGRLAALTTLRLDNNQLSGTIPVSFGKLFKLRYLDLSHNSLEGVVSESHLANLSMLKYFAVASNSKLTFNVSCEWMPPFQLISVNLRSCKIENGFPWWLRNQRKLYKLDMSNTTISGPLPTWLGKMPIIPVLNLAHNNLNGPLINLPSGRPNNGGNFYIKTLYLQNNNFNESIPRSLCTMTYLYSLDLSRNRLIGKIPKCFQNMQHLMFIKLNSNGLSGVISSFIGRISSLIWLNLSDNNFSGELPVEFGNLRGLNVLDLGDNSFCGKIPKWIGEKIKSLRVFRLHNNNFTGEIPRSLCTNLDLQVLDVAHNNLTGLIPHCLGKLNGMVNIQSIYSIVDGFEVDLTQVMKGISLDYTTTWSIVTNMDLSSNNLVGEIPVELTALSALLGLNLSNNHLSGCIPDNIGNMTALNSLDFSGNNLGGPIPQSITALTFLSHLNLSNNNLSGRIPTGKQLQTLIDPSIYSGNKGLCGAPLPKNCSNHENPTAIAMNKHEAALAANKVWLYMDITFGFAAGFWGVIIVLALKKRWRHKLFMFAVETMDKIHVAVVVRVNKMKRQRKGA